ARRGRSCRVQVAEIIPWPRGVQSRVRLSFSPLGPALRQRILICMAGRPAVHGGSLMRLVLTAMSGGLALTLLLALAVAPGNPTAAEERYRGEAEPSPGELAGEAMSKLMQALDLLI